MKPWVAKKKQATKPGGLEYPILNTKSLAKKYNKNAEGSKQSKPLSKKHPELCITKKGLQIQL